MTDKSADVSPPAGRSPAPFPGLRPYGQHDAMFFFGRDGETDALVRLLLQTRLLAVVGASGSGKSSLVRAGLVPAISGGRSAGGGSRWRVAALRPGDDPMGNLARALVSPGALDDEGGGGPQREAMTEAVLRRSTLGLVEAARQSLPPTENNVLVVVEQFEDLFRIRPAREARNADDASAFVSLLLEATRQTELPLYVVFILRARYLGDCARFKGLPKAVNDGVRLVPRLTRDEMREAITEPLRACRAEITPRLVERLLNDAGSDPRGLPSFQHALMRTWEAWRYEGRAGTPVDFRHYEKAGGIGGSISRHADEVLDEFADAKSRSIAEKVFRSLAGECGVGKGPGEVLKLEALCETVGEDERVVAAVVDAFRREGRSFLRPPAELPLTGDSLVEISYDEVIHSWSRLKSWAGVAGR